LDLTSEQRQILELSAWLHDIGLVGVPRHLIKQWQQSPEVLSEAERALVEHHPVLGQELASFANPLEGVGTVIRAHHERFDGQGYPDQLMGEQIPWLARLLAVAVAFASNPRSPEAALTAIRDGSGRAYDPRAVRAFLGVVPRLTIIRRERDVGLNQLEPGMVLARGVYTTGGTLVLPEGAEIDRAQLDQLQSLEAGEPAQQTLKVYC
jgi:response regulator RpfG family c-di-GMP phosphodiesterase